MPTLPDLQPITHEARLEIAREMLARIQAKYGETLIAAGLYGSTGRGSDAPYSDIEFFCVLNTSGEYYAHEWIHGTGKVEINFYSEDTLWKDAEEVEDIWAIRHGEFVNVTPLIGNPELFEKLRTLHLSLPWEVFEKAICDLILFNFFESMGKVRNSIHTGKTEYLPVLACRFAETGALMMGLKHRHVYTTRSKMIQESLKLSQHPAGYAELCDLVTAGELYDPLRVMDAIETFWQGIRARVDEHQINIAERCVSPLE